MERKDWQFEKESDLLSEIYRNFPDNIGETDAKRLHTIFAEFIAGFSLLVDKGPFVTVFGSHKIAEGRPEYTFGRELGGELARSGFAVLTGGGPGLMEAVNRGAHEANGKSMGINISIPGEQESNRYADPSITIKHFFVRKVLLLKYSSAYVFLPGGFGTLDELFETITLIQSKKIKPFPIILAMPKFWGGLTDWIKGKLKSEGVIDSEDIDLLSFAETASDAVEIINNGSLKSEG